MLPTLDAHAHIDPDRWGADLPPLGAVLAVSMSVDECGRRQGRADQMVGWGVGCHPRDAAAQGSFSAAAFSAVMETCAVVGEIGLDGGTRTPPDRQRRTFRSILSLVAERPRIVSIHGYRANTAVLDELERTPVTAPIFHRFEGSAAEAARAVRLGCYFSLHAALARRSLFGREVPLDRVLVESDHGYDDPPAGIPLRVAWVEELVAQRYGSTAGEIRASVWRNFARVVAETRTRHLLPAGIVAALPG